MRKTPYGFTLIELLIVVAIIGILAAIAVPNFLNAQMKAKVARVEAELRTISTAMEMYRADRGYYPSYNNPKDLVPEPHFLPLRLTTPVSYLSSLFNEVFPAQNAPAGIPPQHEYHYFNKKQSPVIVTETYYAYNHKPEGSSVPVEWFSFSHGPDQWDNEAEFPYDVSNGVVSAGDLVRFGP
ncbi:MAG: prepilin-type N-terminal cleavage/methylation domain-containing protein [bacterium]|nr:prepilin-type N-terminal cleavage/methylation domain-containing protein [bacterium]